MTLTEFLMARIAEDQAVAVCCHGAGCPNQDFEFSPGLRDCNELVVGPKRWLVECAAKRRIVEELQWLHDNASRLGPEAVGQMRVVEACCQALASVYVDHPDFDESWRP